MKIINHIMRKWRKFLNFLFIFQFQRKIYITNKLFLYMKVYAKEVKSIFNNVSVASEEQSRSLITP